MLKAVFHTLSASFPEVVNWYILPGASVKSKEEKREDDDSLENDDEIED